MSKEDNPKQPNLKWLMQNIRSIIARNVWSPLSEAVELPTVRMEVYAFEKNRNEKGSVVFHGPFIPGTSNPSWTFSGLTPTETLLDNLDSQVLVIKLLSKNGDYETTVLEETFDLTQLVALSVSGLSSSQSLPVNFVCLDIDDGLFTSMGIFRFVKAKSHMLSQPKILELDPSSYDSDMMSSRSTIDLSQNILSSNQRLDGLRKEVNESWEKNKVDNLKVVKKNRLSELEKLKKELEDAEGLLKEEEKIEKMMLDELFGLADVNEQVENCEKLIREADDINTLLEARWQELVKVKFLLEARQLKLLSELQTIYPIERMESGEYAIRGIELPFDFTPKDDEQVAAALCSVVHLLLLISKYLEVPLRYQLLFLGSRSMIRDPLQGGTGTLPLFRKNVEKERFERAIIWLRRNIEQLLMSRGISYEPSHSVLYNIHLLFQCEMCPHLAF